MSAKHGYVGRVHSAAAGVLEGLRWVANDDRDRYNRYYALTALRRLGSPGAVELLLDSLFTSRLDPVTSQGKMS